MYELVDWDSHCREGAVNARQGGLMSNLARVLTVKIILTVAAWCVPLVLFPVSLLSWLGFVVPEPIVFVRLLGTAYAALVVCYCFGLRSELRGEPPLAVVWVGVVSNGGACVVLGSFGVLGAWSGWGPFAQLVMWASFVGTGGITAGLVVFGLLRSSQRTVPADLSLHPTRDVSDALRG
jgi:hypothetical protein